MVEVRKKAHLTPKLLQGHLSNVKDSLYLLDNTVLQSSSARHSFINQHIEIMASSKLYGDVILLSFRPVTELAFPRDETKLQGLQESKIAVQGPKKVINGISLPGRKENLKCLKADNLTVIDLSPSLSKDTTYAFIRAASDPVESLISLLDAALGKSTQATLIVDKLELLSLLLTPPKTLLFLKRVKQHTALLPFFCHVDFSLVPADNNYHLHLQKLANG